MQRKDYERTDGIRGTKKKSLLDRHLQSRLNNKCCIVIFLLILLKREKFMFYFYRKRKLIKKKKLYIEFISSFSSLLRRGNTNPIKGGCIEHFMLVSIYHFCRRWETLLMIRDISKTPQSLRDRTCIMLISIIEVTAIIDAKMKFKVVWFGNR